MWRWWCLACSWRWVSRLGECCCALDENVLAEGGNALCKRIPSRPTLTKRDSCRSDPHQARFPPKADTPSRIRTDPPSPSAIPDEINLIKLDFCRASPPSKIPDESRITESDCRRTNPTEADFHADRHAPSPIPGGPGGNGPCATAQKVLVLRGCQARPACERKVASPKVAAFARLVQFLRHVLDGAQKTAP